MKNHDQDQKTKKRYKLQIECDESLKEALRLAAKKGLTKPMHQ
jgi:LPS O-antigen subunit length determinant protein (WzzB/FepE family)